MTRETRMLNHLMHDIRALIRNSPELMTKLGYYNRGLYTLGELLCEVGQEHSRIIRAEMEAEYKASCEALESSENGETA